MKGNISLFCSFVIYGVLDDFLYGLLVSEKNEVLMCMGGGLNLELMVLKL